MPDYIPPEHPDFGFFNDRPDQRLSDDENDHRATYPTEPEHFGRYNETDEIQRLIQENERLTAQLARVRVELALLYASHPIPTYLDIWLAPLSAALGME